MQSLLNGVDSAYKTLQQKGNYNPKDLKTVPEYKKLVQETTAVFKKAIKQGITSEIPEVMRKSLDEDVFLFSALKTHAQLFEASRLLTKPDGTIRSAYEFEKAVLKIKETYNVNYLDAERQFAITAAGQAANWVEVEKDGDRYNLQYRTAADERVRKTHLALEGITLPVSDDFWNEYYPPNGWRCRCVAIQVNKDKYETSDSGTAVMAGRLATTQIGKNGKNKLAIFRFNPGKQKIIFPPSHPYTKLPGATSIKSSMKNTTTPQSDAALKTAADLTEYFKGFAEKFPEYFAHGFREIKVTTQRGVNGFTDMRGNISLKADRINRSIESINSIRNGIATTYEQEDALSTLHHEIWHNANKPGNILLTRKQRSYMEMANEFVSRKTLPDFMKKLGGSLQNSSLINDRPSTGYNPMVVNYDYLIQWAKAKPDIVLSEVKAYLIEGTYTNQIQGLINGIMKGSQYELKPAVVKSLISSAERSYSLESFKRDLTYFEDLLIKKTR